MADGLTKIRSIWIALVFWLALIALSQLNRFGSTYLRCMVEVAFLCLYLGYPLLLIFSTSVIPSSKSLRAFALVCCVVLSISVAGQLASPWLACIGMLGALGIQFAAVHVLVEEERRRGLYQLGSGIKAWLSLFFLPFLGLLVLKRHKKLVELGRNPSSFMK